MDRPMVNTYEPDEDGVEQLVYRPMNDEEFEEWKQRQERAKAPEPDHSLLGAIKALSDEDKAALRAALGVS